MMLDSQLNSGGKRRVEVVANPDRAAGARLVLERDSEVDVFILDDGFQHRKIARDFDLVLIDATEPFGFGHVLPRGLMRAGKAGLGRGDAILITRADQVEGRRVEEITREIRAVNASAPVFACEHLITAFCDADGAADLADVPFFAFAGIGNPESFGQQLQKIGRMTGRRWFEDHHGYSDAEMAELVAEAKSCGAAKLVTTEKDWVKVRELPAVGANAGLFLRAELEIRFRADHEMRLLDSIGMRIKGNSGATARSAGDRGGL
jgi:tetraacyldisaccharide 4'-kinase